MIAFCITFFFFSSLPPTPPLFIKLSLSQPSGFLTLALPIFSPFSPILLGPGGGGEQAAGWSLAAYFG